MLEADARPALAWRPLISEAEYAAAFPARAEEYAARAASDGHAVPGHVLEPRDVRALQLARALRGQDGGSAGGGGLLAALLWLEVARVYEQEGLLADAEAAALQAFRAHEVHAPAFAAFARIEEARGHVREAAALYRRGLVLDRDDCGCLLGLARVLLAGGGPGAALEAETHVRRVLRRDAAVPEAWALLGRACSATGRVAEAGAHLRRALAAEGAAPLRPFRMLPVL